MLEASRQQTSTVICWFLIISQKEVIKNDTGFLSKLIKTNLLRLFSRREKLWKNLRFLSVLEESGEIEEKKKKIYIYLIIKDKDKKYLGNKPTQDYSCH